MRVERCGRRTPCSGPDQVFEARARAWQKRVRKPVYNTIIALGEATCKDGSGSREVLIHQAAHAHLRRLDEHAGTTDDRDTTHYRPPGEEVEPPARHRLWGHSCSSVVVVKRV
jgi:hypothetical protein